MIDYFLKRMISLIPLLLGITFFAFALLKALPGDPVTNMVGERTSPEIVQELRRQIGADRPFIAQYAGYLNLLLQGNLGRSHITQREVAEDIKKKLPNTIKLAFAAIIIALPLGITLGMLSAYHSKGIIGRFVDAFTIGSLSVPVFWSGLVFMLVFGLTLKLLPPSGTGGAVFLVLPALTLSIPAMATIARVARTSIVESLSMPWVRTANAKGLNPLRVTLVHVLKNALIPIITIVGLDIGSYLNGAVVTETIFGWDGIGRFTMEGLLRRDYPVIIGSIITGATIFVVVNALTDVLYHIVDPRIRLDAKDR